MSWHRTTQPPAAFVIIGITVLAFFIQNAAFVDILRVFALWPVATPPALAFGDGVLATGFKPWQLISYGFLHGGWGHLFFNMFAFYMFGLPIERAWGTRRFVIFYVICLIGAGLVQLLVAGLSGEIYPTIGASGAVFGILLAFGMMYPNTRLMLLFPPIPIKAKWFVLGYGALTLVFGITGTMPGVAHFAHLGGMIFGLGLILYWGRQDQRRKMGGWG